MARRQVRNIDDTAPPLDDLSIEPLDERSPPIEASDRLPVAGRYERYRARKNERAFRKELGESIRLALSTDPIFVSSREHQKLAEQLVAEIRPGSGIVVRLIRISGSTW